MNFTLEQQNAIDKKGSNILVAAAAGSGKTAVLVERIIQKILKQNIDIDKLLVVTFTNAAASEMRERVLDAIYKKLDEEPENINLQRQINLLGKSNICTIHSFCLDVIKNNFFEIDISPNFRIAADEEIVLLKQEVLEDLFEKKYESEEKEFLKLIDAYTDYRGDETLKSIVLKLYEFSQSAPFPDDWLIKRVEMFNPDKKQEEDFGKTVWGKILLEELREELLEGKNNLRMIQNEMMKHLELDKFTSIISQDIEVLREFEEALKTSWDLSFEYAVSKFEFDRWPSDKKIVMPLKDEAKDIRSNVKDKIKKEVQKILLYNSEDAYRDIFEMYEILVNLKDLVIDFENDFKLKKKEKNIIDFNDIEHYALDILVKKDNEGNLVPSEVAKRYAEKFEEIAIDEYQDSNQVQEHILNSVSTGENVFMVGDVKQSIYKFRRACPDLFINKYDTYSLDGNDKGLKIKLFKNFRSRENILAVTNSIFESIMSKELGDIDYNEEEYLNLGADFENVENGVGKSEICIIDINEDEKLNDIYKIEDEYIEGKYKDKNLEDIDEDEILEENSQITKEEIESKFVARKIRYMIDNNLLVKDKKEGLREIKYKDIVVLLRSTKCANIFEKEFLKNDIPSFTDGGAEYLDTIEIQTIMNLLKILDNPLDDIPLVSVLRSVLFGFTDNEIIEIRLVNRDKSFWNSIIEASQTLENENLKEKVNAFLEQIKFWKFKSEYLALSEFIWEIYVETGYYNYVTLMPNGVIRRANLKMLFERAKEYEKTSFKGLFNFIRFIEKLKGGNSDLSSAKVIGENEDVVRIMSIHKSKGLEFPVVFLCNSNKKINLQDLNGDILLHSDIGIGPEYINYERKIEYSTAAKNAIKVKLKEENISEEMRILYVALTRAKEKLIITAVKNNEEKELEKKKSLLEMYVRDKKINPILLKKYTSYLDWIELVKLNREIINEPLNIFDFNIFSSKDIYKEETSKQEEVTEIDLSKYKNIDKIKEKLDWKYKNIVATKLPIKSTVSNIKEMENEGLDFNQLNNKEVGLAKLEPKFLGNDNFKASRRGTLTHLVLQKIDFSKINSEKDVLEFLEYLVSKNFMNGEEIKQINSKRIFDFINSDFALNIKQAKMVYKEKPFCIKIKANEIFEEAKEEEILVQGIIDLYYINKSGNIVLVDYKTDYVEIGEEQKLVDRYRVQLEIYKKALEESLGKKVDNTYIYSLSLNKEIKI